MALTEVSVARGGVSTVTLAAPTSTTETVSGLGRGTQLYVRVGSTTTTFTVVRPGNHDAGDAVTDYTTGSLVSTERIVNLDRLYQGTTGTATVTFSQLTGVTAAIIRTPLG